jgi:hypothetical protein
MRLPTIPQELIERCEYRVGEIETHGVFIGCMAGIEGHTDEFFPPWSAFLCVRNDGCRVWQRGGYGGTPRAGERFTLNIHKEHGVIAKRDTDLIVLVYADAQTEKGAMRHLGATLRKLRSEQSAEGGE